jgi:hypothetical protein
MTDDSTKYAPYASAEEKAIALNNSRPIDVHRTSDYKEVKQLRDKLYEEIIALPTNKRPQRSWKQHLTMIIVDLYDCYLIDPTAYVGYSRNNNKYRTNSTNSKKHKRRSRYNALGISYDTMVRLTDNLVTLGYIELHKGFKVYDNPYKEDRQSRMRAKQKLIDEFTACGFKAEVIQISDQKECVIMKDGDKNVTDYRDNSYSRACRVFLQRYRSFLYDHYIDIAYNFSQIELDRWILLGDKQVTRVFNNNSWEDGGRFYGGFWQQIPSSLRRYIIINGKETVELDYRSLHPALLYARRGLPPYTFSDPYIIEGEEAFLAGEERHLRKQLLLHLLNAADESKAIGALEQKIRDNPEEYPETYDLEAITKGLKRTHEAIAEDFATGIGVKLQKLDADMAQQVMQIMMEEHNEVVLCIHDSFICAKPAEDKLKEAMRSAFAELASTFTILSKEDEDKIFDGITRRDRYYSKPLTSKQTETIDSRHFRSFSYYNNQSEDLIWKEQLRRQRLWEQTKQTTFNEAEGVYFSENPDKASRKGKTIFKAKELDSLQKQKQLNKIHGLDFIKVTNDKPIDRMNDEELNNHAEEIYPQLIALTQQGDEEVTNKLLRLIDMSNDVADGSE